MAAFDKRTVIRCSHLEVHHKISTYIFLGDDTREHVRSIGKE